MYKRELVGCCDAFDRAYREVGGGFAVSGDSTGGVEAAILRVQQRLHPQQYGLRLTVRYPVADDSRRAPCCWLKRANNPSNLLPRWVIRHDCRRRRARLFDIRSCRAVV